MRQERYEGPLSYTIVWTIFYTLHVEVDVGWVEWDRFNASRFYEKRRSRISRSNNSR